MTDEEITALRRERRRTRRGNRGTGRGRDVPQQPEAGIPADALDRLRRAYEARRS